MSPLGHSRGGSGSGWTFSYDEPLRLVQYAGVRAHQQPITVMTCDYTRLITGAHDHTLKVPIYLCVYVCMCRFVHICIYLVIGPELHSCGPVSVSIFVQLFFSVNIESLPLSLLLSVHSKCLYFFEENYFFCIVQANSFFTTFLVSHQISSLSFFSQY